MLPSMRAAAPVGRNWRSIVLGSGTMLDRTFQETEGANGVIPLVRALN